MIRIALGGFLVSSVTAGVMMWLKASPREWALAWIGFGTAMTLAGALAQDNYVSRDVATPPAPAG